jgi:uncharacterized protein YdaU (DUF1376 family)
VNYYPFHIGDFAAHTAHLSWEEDIAYRRMLDWYYLNEKALPGDPVKVARLIRMPQSLDAISTVLEEFFVLSDNRFHNKRADEELAAMHAKQEQQAAKDANETERMRRYRERRAEMFAELRKHNIVPPWDVPMKELQRLYDDNCNGPATDLQREQVQTCNGPATAIPTPTPTPTPTPVSIPPLPPAGGEATAAVKRKRSRNPVPMREWLDDIRAKGEKPIPEGDPVFDYAEKVGLPIEFLRLAWCEFKDLHTQPGGKRQSDWRRTFRNAVRGNWLKLWWLDGEEFALTTTGHQARKAHEDRAA